MEIPQLHPWNLDYSSARQLQTELQPLLHLHPQKLKISTIAGCDVSFSPDTGALFSAVVISSFPEFKIMEKSVARHQSDFPYIPGLLSFRELPVLLKAFAGIKIPPDLILCDGSGLIHPRKLGLACHLGLWLNLPTIGCAKNPLCGQFATPEQTRGSWSPVYLEGEVVGFALRTRSNIKPIFVSPGNLISLEQALYLSYISCGKYRIPQPIRFAHQLANDSRNICLH